MTCVWHPGVLRIRSRQGRIPTLQIGPHLMISTENQFRPETTKSLGGQSTSMTTTTHQVCLHPVEVHSRFQGHWDPGDIILTLRSDSGCILHEVENLQSSVSSNPCKTTTKPCEDAISGSHFHGFVNYTSFGLKGDASAQDLYAEIYRGKREVPNVAN